MSENPADSAETASVEAFTHDHYRLRRQLFTLLHTNLHIYAPDGSLVLYSRMKGLRLREDVRLYSDESMSRELLAISTRNVIDFAAAYEVRDSLTGEHIGNLKRKGLKSMLRDEWTVAGPDDAPLAVIREDSTAKAMVRRFIDIAAIVMPQRYHAEVDGTTAVTFHQNFNPFVQKLSVEFTDPDVRLDRRLALAAAVLLLAIEGRQD